jgi:cell division protein FtsI/penicillin-binding protein 2
MSTNGLTFRGDLVLAGDRHRVAAKPRMTRIESIWTRPIAKAVDARHDVESGHRSGRFVDNALQMAQFCHDFGQSRVYYQPHLCARVSAWPRRYLWIAPVRKNGVGMAPQNLEFLAAAMCEVVNEAGGTGMAASGPGVLVAGKTGTAQNPHGDTHAWFIGFAPFESAQVAICVFVENGGSGGGVAAPLAGTMLKRYFQLYPADAAREKR